MAEKDDGQQCKSVRVAPLGMYMVTLRCIHVRSMHPGHGNARRLGDVSVLVTWPGEFEEEED